MIRKLFFLIGCATLVASCTEPPVTQEYMIISPDTVRFTTSDFAAGDSAKFVSITHSCTCPFTWHSAVVPTAAAVWLTFPMDTTGDHTSVPISVSPSLYPKDTNYAAIAINSNSYGIDSIYVIAMRK